MTPRRHTGDCGRRRASTRRPSRVSTALHLADALEPSCPVPSSPSILILELVRPESSRVAAVRRVGHGSPPRLDSSHPELRSLAVHPLRPPTSAAEPLLRRIEPQIAPTAIAVHRSFASPPTTFLPATLRPKPSRGELLATPPTLRPPPRPNPQPPRRFASRRRGTRRHPHCARRRSSLLQLAAPYRAPLGLLASLRLTPPAPAAALRRSGRNVAAAAAPPLQAVRAAAAAPAPRAPVPRPRPDPACRPGHSAPQQCRRPAPTSGSPAAGPSAPRRPWPRKRARSRGGGAAGPAPTAMWGPAVSPPFPFMFLSFNPLTRLKLCNCIGIRRKMLKMQNKFC